MSPRPDATRIAAFSIALCLHVVAVMALFLPAAPLRRKADVDPPLVVDVVPLRVATPPAPPAPRPAPAARPAPRKPVPAAATASSAPDTPTPTTGGGAPWRYDPSADATVVVYGEKPALDLVAPDVPPAELPAYRQGFDPSTIDGLNGPDAGGSVTFDVLVDEGGAPSALVPQQKRCTPRAYATAMAVIAQWRFAAGTRGGVPVPAWLTVRLEF